MLHYMRYICDLSSLWVLLDARTLTGHFAVSLWAAMSTSCVIYYTILSMPDQ